MKKGKKTIFGCIQTGRIEDVFGLPWNGTHYHKFDKPVKVKEGDVIQTEVIFSRGGKVEARMI